MVSSFSLLISPSDVPLIQSTSCLFYSSTCHFRVTCVHQNYFSQTARPYFLILTSCIIVLHELFSHKPSKSFSLFSHSSRSTLKSKIPVWHSEKDRLGPKLRRFPCAHPNCWRLRVQLGERKASATASEGAAEFKECLTSEPAQTADRQQKHMVPHLAFSLTCSPPPSPKCYDYSHPTAFQRNNEACQLKVAPITNEREKLGRSIEE